MNEANCPSENADMYGLGIRLGFYLQWLAGALAAVLEVKSDVPSIRFGLLAFTAATFLALIVQIATSNVAAINIYIPLLLCFGYFYMFLPISLYRILICCDINRDVTRHTLVVASPEFDIIQNSLLLAVCAFKLWFWSTEVLMTNNQVGCPEFGFLFCRIRLTATSMRVVNLVLDSLMIITFSYPLGISILRKFPCLETVLESLCHLGRAKTNSHASQGTLNYQLAIWLARNTATGSVTIHQPTWDRLFPDIHLPARDG
ncbi:hypothetical protein GGI43DRAFT_210699 [Trichoderma evansii]